MSRTPFKLAKRIHCKDVDDMEKLVHETVMVQGLPLVVEGWNKIPAWKKTMVKWDYLKRHHGNDDIVCRDMRQNVDIEMKMQFFLSSIRNPSNEETLFYGKDLSCPEKWRETIMEKILPPVVAYRGPNGL
ncbi:hypothetical protein BGZ70_003666, partial [Mortierella alpina]